MVTEQKASTEQTLTETVSNEPDKKETQETPQPLTEERIQQLIAEATQKAIEQGKTLGRREMQGIKDREVADIKRRADLAERRSVAYERGLGELDEETRARLTQQRLQGENEYYKTREQEEEVRRQQEIYIQQLDQSLKDEVASLGIDPSDKRVDYASDVNIPGLPGYFEGRKRFSESLTKILKAEKESADKTALDKAEARFKQLESEFRKQNGLDSQDTTAQTGVLNQSDADFMADWGNYKLPDTKENRARYDGIKKKYY